MKLKSNIYAPILFGVILILAGTASILTPTIEGLAVDAFLSSTMIRLVVFLLPIAFYCRVTNFDAVKGLKFRAASVKHFPFILNMALIFFVGSMLFRYVGITYFDSELFLETPDAIPFSLKSENSFLHLLGTMVLPAVLEEIAFRGILLEEYRSYGAFWAVLTSSLMFAMLHLDAGNLVYYLFMGIVLSVITLATESIFPSMILHVGINFSHEYLRPGVVVYLRQAGKSLILPYLLFALFLLLFIFMFSGLEKIYRSKAYQEILQSRTELLKNELEKARAVQSETVKETKGRVLLRNLREIYLSPTFLICIVLFICLIFDVLK